MREIFIPFMHFFCGIEICILKFPARAGWQAKLTQIVFAGLTGREIFACQNTMLFPPTASPSPPKRAIYVSSFVFDSTLVAQRAQILVQTKRHSVPLGNAPKTPSLPVSGSTHAAAQT
jgi:hypothetical protein